MEKLAGVVLSGGQSKRMGRDKALLVYKGKTLLQRGIELLRKYTNNIYVSGREEQSEIAESGKATLIKDLLPDIGPLGGIYSALKTIDQEKFLFIAVDMPFLTPDLLREMLKAQSNCAVKHRGILQPVCCVLEKSILPEVEGLISRKRYSVKSLFEAISYQVVHAQEGDVLRDIDTPEEKDKYLQ